MKAMGHRSFRESPDLINKIVKELSGILLLTHADGLAPVAICLPEALPCWLQQPTSRERREWGREGERASEREGGRERDTHTHTTHELPQERSTELCRAASGQTWFEPVRENKYNR